MSIGKLKLQQIAFWIVVGAISTSAATLVTKSGKHLTNYTILRQEGLVVIVSHQSGINKIPIADLPDFIASRYIKPAATRRIAVIMREKDPGQRVKKLEELISQLPAAEEYAKEPLAQARQEKDLEDTPMRSAWKSSTNASAASLFYDSGKYNRSKTLKQKVQVSKNG